MPAGANPVSRPVRIATACGAFGTPGHFLTFPSFSGTFPARSTPPPAFFLSCFSTTGGSGGGGSSSKQRSLVSAATRHHPPLAAASLGLRGQQKPLLLERRSARGSGLSAGWASGRLRMSGEGGADGATSAAGSDKQEGGSDSGSGGGGASTKGGRGGEAFASVTLDADAVQKFAEIQVRWGECCRPTIGQGPSGFYKRQVWGAPPERRDCQRAETHQFPKYMVPGTRCRAYGGGGHRLPRAHASHKKTMWCFLFYFTPDRFFGVFAHAKRRRRGRKL